ncbi:MAG: hypothetical protein DCC71_04680 [Proteobacteria bacterium]|nr:MAG: hypothetical protein DCC71_04680 [Pseudomonadota bacterium]
MNKGNSDQPFCSSGFGNLMHGARDHSQSNATCYTANSDDHGTLDDAGIDTPFFDFLYTMQEYRCNSSSHPQGQTFYPAPPGWLVEYRSWKSLVDDHSDVSEDTGIVEVPRSSLHAQYHWPVLDANAVACASEPATGQVRTRTALNGRTQVPKLCGADFDAWFDKWIAPPANVQSAPALQTPAPIVQEVPHGATSALAHHEITVPVDYAAQVQAVDPEDGALPVACFPASGTRFQLGTTEVRCAATDADGSTTEAVFPVHVRFPFRFVGKVGERGAAPARAGATVAVAFSLGGDRGLDAIGALSSQAVDCRSGAALAAPEPARGRAGLRWQRGPRPYRFGWATERAWQGSCRELRIALVDGSVHTAEVAFAPHGQGHGGRGKGGPAKPAAKPRHAKR